MAGGPCEDDGVEAVDATEEDGVGRQPRIVRGPREPTHQEREQHEVSHLPPRDWCAHCR